MNIQRLLCALALTCATLVAAEPAHPEWWRQAEQSRLLAPCLAREPRDVMLDGLLDDWDGYPALPLGLTHQALFESGWRGRTDLSASLRLGSTPYHFLLAADVVDDKLAGHGRVDRGDHLLLFCGPTNATKPALRGVRLIPATDAGAAQVVDFDTGEPVPGGEIVSFTTERGYRLEARIPWSQWPGGEVRLGGRRAFWIEVNDYDGGDERHAHLVWPADIRPPAAPPAEPKPEGWQPPQVAEKWRPEKLAEFEVTAPFELDAAGPYLSALLPIGAERSYYDGGEDVRVLGLTGLGVPAAALMDVYLVDEQGEPELLPRGDAWREGAVEGWTWSWYAPYDFASSRLLAASLPVAGLADQRVYGRIESVGASYRLHQAGLLELQDEMLRYARQLPPDDVRRRYVGAVVINLEDKQQAHSAWRSWMSRDDLDKLAAEVADLRAKFETAQGGADPYAGKKGSFLRGYVSDIDDSVQHYSVDIPEAWKPGAKMPLVIGLHGYGFGRFHGHPAPSFNDKVGVACYGRGNGDYKLWCERDILYVIQAMKDDYGIDPDRVYVTGGSMGGTGSFHMSSLFPDLFAAIGPSAANANHRVWEEVWGWGQREPTFMTPFRDWLEDTTSAWWYQENMRNVGAFILHGDKDNICPVGHARTTAERLRNLGYDAVYEEYAGVGHGGFPGEAGNRQKNFMFSRTRDPWPAHVTYKTSWHRYDGAYWVRVERFRKLATDAIVDARVDGQTITVTTTNVDRFSLHLGTPLLSLTEPVKVVVDGVTAYDNLVTSDGVVRLGWDGAAWAPAELPGTVEKNQQVGGPIEHAFMQRFLVVCGTGGDERENLVNRRMTQQLAEKWKRWGRGMPARVKMDWEVTDQDIAESNLICFGGPGSNRLVQRVNDKLPIRFEAGAVVFGEERFPGRDVGVKLCYPNPLNPRRYLCIFAGTTWEGTYDINGRFGNWFDWGVFDDRNWFDFGVFDAHTQSPETFLAVGYFDEDWGLGDQAVVFRGDPEMRRATRPRRPPDPLAGVPVGETVWISELTPRAVNMEKGVLGYDQSFEGRPITLGDMTFDRGLGVHPQAEVVYDLEKQFETFEAWVGIDLEGATAVSQAREEAERVAFQVYGDGKQLADTGEMRWNTPPKRLRVNVSGVRELKLMARALDGRKWLFGDASWGLAKLTRKPDSYQNGRAVPDGADHLNLAGAWTLDDFEVGEGLARGAERDGEGVPEHRVVMLPGTIAAGLMSTGELPNLDDDDGLRAADKLGDREWWLYRSADVPAAWAGQTVSLRLDGVAQFAEVFCNGSFAGRAAGPFAPVSIDLTKYVRYGQPNRLAIRLLAGEAPWTNVKGYKPPRRDEIVGYGVGYGLDGGGQALVLGITRGLELRTTGQLTLSPLQVTAVPRTTMAAGPATVPTAVTIATTLTNLNRLPADVILKGRLEPLSGDESALPFERKLSLAAGEQAAVRIELEPVDLRLWWPAQLGDRPRYRVVLEARVGEQLSDARSSLFGVRTVSLPSQPEAATVLVNGAPVRLRIAEWRPVDRHYRPAHETTEHLLRLALAAGFNTVRVWAGGGLADEAFYEACDRLGLLVIQDLPLLGEVGRTPEDAVTAATVGIAQAVRQRPSVVAVGHGQDWTGANLDRRRQVLDLALRRAAPELPQILPTTSGARGATWTWLLPAAEGEARQAVPMPLAQVDLPGGPPADLAFLHRDKLPVDERAMPWPLTDVWKLHGGRDAELDAAAAWLGPVADEDGMLQLLLRRQTHLAQQQMAGAMAAGGAVMVSPLNESWPQVSGALVDHAGVPRPAFEVCRRLLSGPCIFAVGAQTAAEPGETLVFDLYAEPATGGRWWETWPRQWATIRSRIIGLDGTTWAELELPIPADHQGGQPVGKLTWIVGDDVPDGAYLLLTEAPRSGLEPEVVPLAIRTASDGPRATVAWYADPAATWPSFTILGPAELTERPDGGPDVYYLGPASSLTLTDDDAHRILSQVRDGVGVVLDGPPAWLAGTPLEALLPALPVAGPPDLTLEPVRPAVVLADHPALAGLRGGLPEGVGGDWQQLAEGAETLVQFGPQQPLVVEGSYGRGRVLLLRAPGDYGRRLALWNGQQRFLMGLAAYASKMSYSEAKRLLDAPSTAPLAPLAALPESPVKLTVANAPLTLTPELPATREVQLRNEGGTPVLLAQLRLLALPDGLAASFDRASFTLLPGETRKALLTVRATRRGRREGEATLRVDGWGAAAAEVKLTVRSE